MDQSLQNLPWLEFVHEVAADLSDGRLVFPTSFDITIKLRELLRSETAGIDEITQAISADPLLAARLIQVANSAAFASAGGSTSNIRAAVVRLGLEQVRNLAMAVAMAQLVTYRQMVPYRALGQKLLQHSRWVAGCSVILAREHSAIDAGSAYFAGLIHDIGVFYLLFRLSHHTEFVMETSELHALLREWHGQIGHAVLATLGVPEIFQDAVAEHESIRPIHGLAQLPDLLFVANLLAESEPAGRSPLGRESAAGGGVTVDRLETYRASVVGARGEIESLSRAFA